jgi:hypothetical protein
MQAAGRCPHAEIDRNRIVDGRRQFQRESWRRQNPDRISETGNDDSFTRADLNEASGEGQQCDDYGCHDDAAIAPKRSLSSWATFMVIVVMVVIVNHSVFRLQGCSGT